MGIEVTPIVTGAEVDTNANCDACGSFMVRLTVSGFHVSGLVELPDIRLCPDCYDVKQVVEEWHERLRHKQ